MTRRLAAAIALAVSLFATNGLVAARQAPPATVGEALPSWTPGTLDIHQLATGRGNSAFIQFPDGTTLLVDAGDSGPVNDPARPPDPRTAGEQIVTYIRHAMRGSAARLDYALLTHYHPDHMGQITGREPKSSRGSYLLNGITEVAEQLSIDAIVDRGYDYDLPSPDVNERVFANYRAFVASNPGMRHIEARAGATDQLVLKRSTPGLAPFEARIVSVNDRVWTGKGDAAKTRFAPLASLAPEDRPSENMCSVTLRLKYGAFDFFTGGDQPGYPVPGAPEWHDVESDVARAIGPTDVHIVNHHGSIEEENLFWLRTLNSRVLIVPAWAPTHPSPDVLKRILATRVYPKPRDVFVTTHPSPDVLKRILATRVYPKPRDVFVTMLRQATKDTIGARATQVASDHGHVVVRVEPGGDRYWVIVLEEGGANSARIVKGPYHAE